VPGTTIEILVPDFRGRMETALEALAEAPPDVFNHNLETVPRLYRRCRPGADYRWSLELLRTFGERHPEDGVTMLTLGQYLQPSREHLPVKRFVTPGEFDELRRLGESMGFANVASGPMVRSSYHADLQADPLLE